MSPLSKTFGSQTLVDTTSQTTKNATSSSQIFTKETVPSILEIKKQIPSQCFSPSILKSLQYVILDLSIIAVLFFLFFFIDKTTLIPEIVKDLLILPIYSFAQGTMFWAIFVLGHDCGHGSFSRYPLFNDIIGTFLHLLILVPYTPWKLSHRHHHKNTVNLHCNKNGTPDLSLKLTATGFESSQSVTKRNLEPIESICEQVSNLLDKVKSIDHKLEDVSNEIVDYINNKSLKENDNIRVLEEIVQQLIYRVDEDYFDFYGKLIKHVVLNINPKISYNVSRSLSCKEGGKGVAGEEEYCKGDRLFKKILFERLEKELEDGMNLDPILLSNEFCNNEGRNCECNQEELMKNKKFLYLLSKEKNHYIGLVYMMCESLKLNINGGCICVIMYNVGKLLCSDELYNPIMEHFFLELYFLNKWNELNTEIKEIIDEMVEYNWSRDSKIRAKLLKSKRARIINFSLAVSVVPEGLVAVTTVTMAIGVIRMAARCAIVRTLPAVETLGSVTVICSDKTGTLTEGKMGPCELWTADNSIYSFTEPTSLDPNKGGIIFHSLECRIGDPTEVTQKGGFSKSYWENNHNFLKVHEKPFDSERKLMSVVYKINKDSSSSSPSQKKEENKNKFLVLAKGAPEELLRKCTHYMAEIKSSNNNNAEIFDAISEDNYSSPLTEEFVDLISDQSSRMASKEGKDEENNLIFIGLIGLIDPPKKAVKESIRICKLAGIKVIMITELDLLSDEAISELNPFPTVFARVSPDNKLKIVKALQNLKNIVAMTGDGVNDAPAIKAADVGVAMGLSGTEITKQAADIILSNDDFSTIVAAVEEGRRVFDNILKFIVYLLSCNSAEIIIMLICAVINLDLPFTTIMILWANIIVEPVEKDIMKRKPRNPNAGVLDLYATTILITQSFVMALLSFGVFIIALSPIEHIELADARSLAFATLTSMQLIQGFFSRTLYESVFKTGFFTNKWMIVSVVGSFIALLLGIYVPGLREWLDLTPVPAFGWAKIAICVIIQLIISELGKFIGRMYRDKKK
ncbi:625_t:CDS:10 [Entrophospora sp. SA101]|nr:625_t:CDS:10 [Entrophospora sp. SA101]